MTDLLAAVWRANLMASLLIVLVIALRPLFRRWFGAEVAYGLWAAPPLAALGAVLPARLAPASANLLAASVPPPLSSSLQAGLLIAWGLGAAVVAGMFLLLYRRFLAETRKGAGGAAVVGVAVPRVVMPPDDGRYSVEERALMRTHEREHIARGDPLANAWMAAFQCLAWFNPLVHVGVALARLDQELACDASVLRRNRRSKALYASTLLKAQLMQQAPPLVSCWAAGGRHPLEVRVGAMARIGLGEGDAGPMLVTGLALIAAVCAWFAQPPAAPPGSSIIWVPVEIHHQPPMSVLLIRVPAPN
ncbi:MAG: M56 family metallopeptidase [Phenylobacterium sp.]